MSCRTSAAEALLAAQSLIAENSDFESTGSVESAKKYIDGLNTLIPLLPQRQQLGGAAGESINWSIKELREMRNDAVKWLNARTTVKNGRMSRVGFCRYRT